MEKIANFYYFKFSVIFLKFPFPTPSLPYEVVPLPESIFLPSTLSRFLVPPSLPFFQCPRMCMQSNLSISIKERCLFVC